jgi:hypothetical protein
MAERDPVAESSYLWRGGDGERVPLELGHVRHLEEEPLARLVLEARLVEPDLHRAGRVEHHLDDLGLSSGSDLSVHPLAKVQDPDPDRAEKMRSRKDQHASRFDAMRS